jgi:hypothetical protein
LISVTTDRQNGIGFTGTDRGDGLRRFGLDEGDPDPRMLVGQASEELRHEHRRRRREGDEAHPPTPQPRECRDLLGRRAHRSVHRNRVSGEDRTGLGEADAPTDALDDRHAEPTLEPAEMLAHRRLTRAERVRGGRDRPGRGDGADDEEGTGVEGR